MTVVSAVATGIHKSMKALHIDWLIDEYVIRYWARNNSVPPKVGVEPGWFRCPACKRKFITARPVRESLLEHLNECDLT